jgi:hypothetical protein
VLQGEDYSDPSLKEPLECIAEDGEAEGVLDASAFNGAERDKLAK